MCLSGKKKRYLSHYYHIHTWSWTTPPSSFHTHHNYLQAIIVMQLAIQPAMYKQKLSQRENFHFYSAAAFKWWLMWKLYLILNTISICVFNLSFTNKKSNWGKSSKQIKDYGHNEIMKRQLPILFIVLKRLAICFERKPFLLLVAYYNVRVGKLFLQSLVVQQKVRKRHMLQHSWPPEFQVRIQTRRL